VAGIALWLEKPRSFALEAFFAPGIGTTTVIFSVVHSLLLDPFPCKNAEKLASIFIYDVSYHNQPVRTVSTRFGGQLEVDPKRASVPQRDFWFSG